jgi:hypothetical protein
VDLIIRKVKFRQPVQVFELHKLILAQGLETTTRRKRNIKDFEQAFSSNWKKQYPQHPRPPEMKVVLDDQVKSIASGFQGGAAAHSK